MKLYLGCDPGQSGAVAAVDVNGAEVSWISGTSTDRDLLDQLREWSETFECRAALEEVGAKPRIGGDGKRVSMGAKSAFTFGDSNGRLRMALIAAGIPFETALPAKWQAAMRCRTKGDKRVSKARAQELLPGERITHRNADAYLLALYCRQTQRGPADFGAAFEAAALRDIDNPAAEAAEKGGAG